MEENNKLAVCSVNIRGNNELIRYLVVVAFGYVSIWSILRRNGPNSRSGDLVIICILSSTRPPLTFVSFSSAQSSSVLC